MSMTDQTAEVESPQSETADIGEASSEDIRAALGLTPEPTETPEEGAVETPAGEAVPEETQETEQERLSKRRIRPRTAEDQQVIDLYRSEGFEGTFDDASKIIYGQQQQPVLAQQQAEAPPPDPFAGDKAQAQALQGEITELEAKVTEAADNLDTTEALQHQREIMRKEIQLQSLKSRYEREVERQQQEQFNTHRDKSVESRDRVYAAYPEMADENSVLRKSFDNFVASAQQDPDYTAVFESPKWPEIMAREFGAATGTQAQQLPAPVQSPPQRAPAMGTQARVLTSGTAAQPANPQPTAQQVVQNLPNLSKEDLYNLLGQPDGQRYLT